MSGKPLGRPFRFTVIKLGWWVFMINWRYRKIEYGGKLCLEDVGNA